MRKLIGITALLVLASGLAFAATYDVNPSQGHATVTIPDKAEQVSPGVFDLGTVTVDGQTASGVAFIHFREDYRKGFHHRDGHDGGPPGSGGGDDGGSQCYAFLTKHGVDWKTVEPWVMNPSNNEADLTESYVFDNLGADIDKWEDAADGTQDDGSSINILGTGSTTSKTLSADTNSMDGSNEVYFGSVAQDGAIAVTIVWYESGGPPGQREILEWDQVYDQVDFDWSDSGDSGKMDFANIATHEIGHAVGMGHPDDSCTEQTMYAYADTGETKKRTLENGDVNGVAELY